MLSRFPGVLSYHNKNLFFSLLFFFPKTKTSRVAKIFNPPSPLFNYPSPPHPFYHNKQSLICFHHVDQWSHFDLVVSAEVAFLNFH